MGVFSIRWTSGRASVATKVMDGIREIITTVWWLSLTVKMVRGAGGECSIPWCPNSLLVVFPKGTQYRWTYSTHGSLAMGIDHHELSVLDSVYKKKTYYVNPHVRLLSLCCQCRVDTELISATWLSNIFTFKSS